MMFLLLFRSCLVLHHQPPYRRFHLHRFLYLLIEPASLYTHPATLPRWVSLCSLDFQLNKVLLPNPFDRPRAVFLVEIDGSSGMPVVLECLYQYFPLLILGLICTLLLLSASADSFVFEASNIFKTRIEGANNAATGLTGLIKYLHLIMNLCIPLWPNLDAPAYGLPFFLLMPFFLSIIYFADKDELIIIHSDESLGLSGDHLDSELSSLVSRCSTMHNLSIYRLYIAFFIMYLQTINWKFLSGKLVGRIISEI